MSLVEDTPVARFTVDALRVVVHEDRARLGRAAAREMAQAIAARQAEAGRANVVFASAPSQIEFLASLVALGEIDWSRVIAFHMDEYVGIGPDHPHSFRRFLQERLFGLVGLSGDRLRLIAGEDSERPLRTCLAYEDLLLAEPPDIVCAGIGENGHLAFNDPPVADFLDPVLVKVIRLDPRCREQQLHDGGFGDIADIPSHGYTLTIPALLSAPTVSVAVPGPRKAEAVLTTLKGPIAESCPASALRRHAGATLHLDRESARLVI